MAAHAEAAPYLLMDAASGEVLEQQEATRSWFPASTAKLMTVYVALEAVAAGRITLDTPMMVSPRAMSMSPTKMGFLPGVTVTLDNALKMLMLKSANDIAVTIAEGVSGSVEAFAGEMNAAATRLGMRESRWTNPNGLPDPGQVSSARDLAVLAKALLERFPERTDLYNIGAMRVGGRIFPTHNGLLGRYPGADGMKTGFTCSAGFNIVASATRGGRKLIAVVLGAPSATARTMKAANLFDRGFAGRTVRAGALTALASNGVAEAPDMRNGVCRNRSKALAQYMAEINSTPAPPATADVSQAMLNAPERSLLTYGGAGALAQAMNPAAIAALPRPAFMPIDVFVGPVPGWTGTIAHADDYSGPPPSTVAAYADGKAAETPIPSLADAQSMKRGAAAKGRGKAAAKAAARTRVAKATPGPTSTKRVAAAAPAHVKMASVGTHKGGKKSAGKAKPNASRAE